MKDAGFYKPDALHQTDSVKAAPTTTGQNHLLASSFLYLPTTSDRRDNV